VSAVAPDGPAALDVGGGYDRGMALLYTILIGFVIGLVARFLMPGRDRMGFILTTLLGIGGALVANFVGHEMGWYARSEVAGFLAAVAGAVGLLFVCNLLRRP
jgi:uncharacterized membrane protein YeaQ/YmgE (transglycosylase-associated protein family)